MRRVMAVKINFGNMTQPQMSCNFWELEKNIIKTPLLNINFLITQTLCTLVFFSVEV